MCCCMAKTKAVNFRVEEEEYAFLKGAAGIVGVETPSVLMRNVMRAMKRMTPEELRALITRDGVGVPEAERAA